MAGSWEPLLFRVRRDGSDGLITDSVVDPFGKILGIMYNPHYLGVLGKIKKK